MKTKLILAILFSSTCVIAQDVTTPDEIAQKCNENNSVFYQFAKAGNYADAYTPWLELYNACPEKTKNIYKYGVMIVNWKIQQETDATKKSELIDLLMRVYDSRIQYFGNDLIVPKARILGFKAIDYINVPTPKDPLKKEAYKWLEEAINGLGKESDAAFLQYYIWISCNIYRQNPAHLDKLVKDYIQTSEILASNATDSNNPNATSYAQVKVVNDQTVASTKALTAETLDGIYAQKVEDNKANIDFLISTVSLYKTVNAKESPVYFKASEYAHKIKPTEETAVGCANMYLKQKDYDKSISYLEDAVKYTSNNDSKAEYEMMIASIYSSYLKSFSKAREHARASLNYKPNQGEPYLLIGMLYAQSTGIYGDAVLSKTVYWAAVDKFIKAKQVDPSVADKANEYISRYSRYFPEDNEIFMHPDLNKGANYTVGGWIGESTICR